MESVTLNKDTGNFENTEQGNWIRLDATEDTLITPKIQAGHTMSVNVREGGETSEVTTALRLNTGAEQARAEAKRELVWLNEYGRQVGKDDATRVSVAGVEMTIEAMKNSGLTGNDLEGAMATLPVEGTPETASEAVSGTVSEYMDKVRTWKRT